MINKEKGFSLLEILIALAVISVLMVAFMPLLTKKKKVTNGGGDSLPIGTIVMYQGQTPPEGWLLCDGKPIPLKYQALKNFLGKDNTPDMRGYVPKGATDSDIQDAKDGKGAF